MADIVLRPTFWRTCRVLANRERLNILALLSRERELSVSLVAARLQVPVARASLYLRALEARSVLQVRRTGRHVMYRFAEAGYLAPLLRALRQALERGKHSHQVAFALTTAFTHPRRIEIYKSLTERAQKLFALARATGIPAGTLLRHLHKLQSRGYVTHERRRDVYSVTTHQHPLGRALGALAAS